jgi:mono/diheme cytochrome c family protein
MDTKAFARALLVVLAIVVIGGVSLFYPVLRRGLSTRTEPSAAEEFVARTARRLATPRAVRSMNNPVQPTEEVLDEALAHFADHCASCHGNNGSGDTPIGRNLYPRAPDMRLAATQSLSDGELFSIIENGIRLTGMPAWGDGTRDGERGSWGLVRFIRRLPRLTPQDIERMEALNPRTPAEFREDEEARRFLAGAEAPSHTPGQPAKEHGH